MSDWPAVDFFYEHAGFSYDPARETLEEGRRRTAQALAEAEFWYLTTPNVEFRWRDDFEVGNHRDYFGEDSVYADHEPATCEVVELCFDGEFVDGQGCIDDADDDYRRVVEAEMVLEHMDELSRLEAIADLVDEINQTAGGIASEVGATATDIAVAIVRELAERYEVELR